MTRPSFATRQIDGLVELVLVGPWSAEVAELFRAGRADRLILNYALGFNEPSLDFLTGLPIRELVILDRRLTSLEPIYSLSATLESLNLVTVQPSLAVDISRLPKLRGLGAYWSHVQGSIGSAHRLQDIYLEYYPETDLRPLTSHRALAKLVMKDRPALRSLSGLSAFPDLRHLGIFGAAKLDDVSELRGRHSLERLELESCRKISTLDDLDGCTNLTYLNLGDCGDLRSLAPLRGMSQLELLDLSESTKIIDGDLSLIADLPHLRLLYMQSRRHYRPSVAELQDGLPGSRP